MLAARRLGHGAIEPEHGLQSVRSWDFGEIPVFPPDRPHSLPDAIQPKLVIGGVDDPLEHEADRVADRVMRARPAGGPPSLPRHRRSAANVPTAKPTSSRRCRPSLPGRHERGTHAPGMVHATLAAPGRALDRPHAHVSGARGSAAASPTSAFTTMHRPSRSAAAVGARAYTVGRDIVFGATEYRPREPGGMWLLAHEVAHSVTAIRWRRTTRARPACLTRRARPRTPRRARSTSS